MSVHANLSPSSPYDPHASPPEPLTPRELEAMFRPLFERNPDGVLLSSPTGAVLRANPAACRLLGRDEAEICALGRAGLVVPEPRLAALLAERERSGVVHGEVTFLRPDGTTFPAEITSAIIPTRGAERYAYIVFRDATERRRGEERARQQTEVRFRTVFEQAGVGLARVGLDGSFLEVNGPFAELVGYTPEELQSLGFPAITHPDDLAEDLAQANRLLAGEIRTYSMEKRYLRKDGTTVWVSLTGSLTHDPDGKPAYFVAVVKDVSDRKRFEEALLDADRRKSEFLAVLSHELRNPLTPIRNGVFLLERAPHGSPAADRAKAAIRRQVDHLTRLVDDLLDVTRISRGKIPLDPQRLDLADVLRRTCDDHRSMFEAAGVALELALPEAPVWVDADPTRVAQVIGNLLQNAVKFTPAGGRVEAALRCADGRVELAVRDDGIGIAPEELPRLFAPFVQGDQSLARTRGGLGLGLALVKGLVELHGGSVAARSGGRGAGTEITVTLPAAAPPPAGPS